MSEAEESVEQIVEEAMAPEQSPEIADEGQMNHTMVLAPGKSSLVWG